MNKPTQKPAQPIPHDTEAEAGALACVLTSNGDAHILLDRLSQPDFHDLRHRAVFDALVGLQFDNQPLDPVALAQRLKDSDKMQDAGGFEYIASLPDKSPSPANFPVFLETVKDRAARRAMLEEAATMRARALDTSKAVERPNDSLEAILAQRRFNPEAEPRPLRPIYTLAGVPICTPGNLAAITAAAKAGKTATLGAMMAAAMPHECGADLLGFESSNPKGYALLCFDSEQSEDDFNLCITRALKRGGIIKPPPWFRAYYLSGLGHKQAWKLVTEEIRIAAERHGGIHSMFLDGVADFVADVNDAEESNAFVATLHGIAIEHDCPIVGVLHFNPGTEKSRGHLGSQLERKAETNLALEKDADGSTVIYSTKNRRAGIPKDKGPRFKFDVEVGMHVSIESRSSAKDSEKRDNLRGLAEDVFGDRRAMRYSELQVTLKNQLRVSDATAERKLAELCRLSLIRKSAAGLYVLTSPAESE